MAAGNNNAQSLREVVICWEESRLIVQHRVVIPFQTKHKLQTSESKVGLGREQVGSR